jgi:hypothetical protein
MKRTKAEVRLYTIADSEMRQDMRTMHGHYLSDMAAFGTQWLAAIGAADLAKPGAALRSDLKEDTQEVEALMEQARTQVQTLFYYVGQAFPGNAARLDQYGKKQYEQARKKHDKMRALLSLAIEAAERDQDELAEKGFKPAQLAALIQLAEDLEGANTDQEMRKGTNTEGSDDYIRIQNAAYTFGQQVSKAAKVAFAQDPVKQKLYLLGGSGPGPKKRDAPAD